MSQKYKLPYIDWKHSQTHMQNFITLAKIRAFGQRLGFFFLHTSLKTNCIIPIRVNSGLTHARHCAFQIAVKFTHKNR